MPEDRMLPGQTEKNRLFFAIACGLILIPINAYWIALVGGMRGSLHPAYASLFIAPVINLFFLVLLSRLLKRIFPRFALSRAELLMIYQMVVMLCLVSGHDPMDFLLGTLIYPFWFATPENEYATFLHQHIPNWFTVSDKKILKGFFDGESTLYTPAHLSAWLGPVLLWSAITVVLFQILLCINSIQRLQWTEHERLSYPIVQLPIEMTRPGFLRNKLLWAGVAVSASIEILNGLHFLYPIVPSIPIKIYNFGAQILTIKPWSAIGFTPLVFYPWVIGLTFFVPLDLSFSLWFFFLFTKAQLVIGSIGGWRSLPGFPYYPHQGLGAWLTLGVLVLWASRKHLRGVFSKVFDKHAPVDDSKEPLGYRTAMIAIVIGVAVLVLLFHQAGMSIGILLAFLAIYLTMAIAIAHVRAAVGPPFHEIYQIHPHQLLVSGLGTRRIGATNLTLLAFLFPYVRDNVAHPMPAQLEGFKIAERVGISHKKMFIVMTVGLCFSILASFWAYLHVMYDYGAVRARGYVFGFGRENFGSTLLPWLQFPRDADGVSMSFAALGAVFTFFLMLMRQRFIWWPFHPAGYAVGLSLGTEWIWSAVWVSWLIKVILLKSGGLKMYRRAGPFFFGLVVGDYMVGFVWSIIGAIFNIPVYRVWY